MTNYELTEFLLSLRDFNNWKIADSNDAILNSIGLSRKCKNYITNKTSFKFYNKFNEFEINFISNDVIIVYNNTKEFKDYLELIQFCNLINIRLSTYDIGLNRFEINKAIMYDDHKKATNILNMFIEHIYNNNNIITLCTTHDDLYGFDYELNAENLNDYINLKIPLKIAFILDNTVYTFVYRYPKKNKCVLSSFEGRNQLSYYESENYKKFKILELI